MKDPLYRVTSDAPALLREHPPKFRHPHKAALFDIAYADRTASPGEIEVTRWPQHVDEPLSLRAIPADVRPDFYDYAAAGDAASSLEWIMTPESGVAWARRSLTRGAFQVLPGPIQRRHG